jgi:CO/xanthine dehydrogenase Mo-binding subunit
MIHGRVLRSPYAHARVGRIDASAALRVPGVLGVLLPRDVPDRRFNCSGNPPSSLIVKDERVLTDHPLHAGDRIAAVAARSPEACAEALERILVEYEPLPAVMEIEEAMAPGAPILHPELFNTNVFRRLEGKEGDVERGLAASAHVFEGEFRTPAVQHVALEPVGCICLYEPGGKVTIWSNTQAPFQDRRILAELLDLPEAAVRVIKPMMGGGFGGRQQLHNQHVGAFLSRLTGRPVKIVNSREEEMYATATRHGSICHVTAGVSRDGLLQAFRARVHLNTGAYCTHGPIVLGAQSRKFQYRVPNYLYEGFCVYTNAPVAGAMRGYGSPQITFARESLMDTVAQALGLDPVEFRLRNHVRAGDRIPAHTFALGSCAMEACVAAAEAARREAEAADLLRAAGKGDAEAWGVAFGCHTSGPSNNEGLSAAVVLVNDDGSVQLLVGAADMGQGCETTFAQIAAEAMGIGVKDVTVVAADTGITPYDTGSFASSQIYVGGNAVKEAALEAVDQLREALARQQGVDPDAVQQVQGGLALPDRRGGVQTVAFKEAVRRVSFGAHGTVIAGRASFKAAVSPPPFAVCWAKVAVDRCTGSIRVLHVVQAVDVGTAVNPQLVRGQVEGGISMGLGFALMERMEADRRAAKPVSSDLLHYKVATSLDMPELHVRIVASHEPTGPFGAKSVGELPAVPVAAAIANAVANATGQRAFNLPLGGGRVAEFGGDCPRGEGGCQP